MESHNKKLSIWAFALAIAITWSLGIFILGLCAWLFAWGNLFVVTMASIYIGYEATFWGSVIGGLWAFLDGFVGGLIIALIYNACLSCKCMKK